MFVALTIKVIVMSGRVLNESKLPPGSRFFGKPLNERDIIATLQRFSA